MQGVLCLLVLVAEGHLDSLSRADVCERARFPGAVVFLCSTAVILTRLVFKLGDLWVYEFTDYPCLCGQSLKMTKS